MRSQRVTVVFAPELHGRLRWFSGLRWIAVAGLASASLAGRQLGFEGFKLQNLLPLYVGGDLPERETAEVEAPPFWAVARTMAAPSAISMMRS